MSVLIAYAGKTGTTAKCAKILKALMDDATLCDLTVEKPDLRRYNCVIVGGSIRMGSLHKASRNFINNHKEELGRKKCGYFICNCFTDQSKAYLKKNIPQELLEKAAAADSFGGTLTMEDQRGIDRIITKLVEKRPASQNIRTYTSSETIHKFAEKMSRKKISLE